MHKIRYTSLAQAMGAFVAAEMEACQMEPSRLMLDDTNDSDEMLRAEKFSMAHFETHLGGLLADLVEMCMFTPTGEGVNSYTYGGEVVLVIATTDEANATKQEWARAWVPCAQGRARLETYNPAIVEYTFRSATGVVATMTANEGRNAVEQMVALNAAWYEVSVPGYTARVEPSGKKRKGGFGWRAVGPRDEDMIEVENGSLEEALVDAVDLCDQYLDDQGVDVGIGAFGGLA